MELAWNVSVSRDGYTFPYFFPRAFSKCGRGERGNQKVNAGIAHEKITIAGGFTDKGQGTEKSAAAST